MVKAKIFVEGGSPGEKSNAIFKNSWKTFFEAAELSGRMPGVVRGASRTETFDKFKDALIRQKPHQKDKEVLLLLVDSEGPVNPGHSTWQHLKTRPADNWDQPPNAGDDSAYLMVQCMETWFLADHNALRTVFQRNFTENPLREWPNLEEIAKERVYDTLDRATNGRYEKGDTSFKLLARLDPNTVAAACPHADQLLTYLRTL